MNNAIDANIKIMLSIQVTITKYEKLLVFNQ